jgi:CrcB protein
LLISVVGGFLLAYTGMILGIKLGKVGDRRW